MQEILERLERIEAALTSLIQLRTVKDFYSTDEVASILGKAEFTVREWARRGRINADKRKAAVASSSRGPFRTLSFKGYSGKVYCPKTEARAACCVEG